MPNAWASYSVNTAKHGDTRQQVGLNGTTLADNNLSYSLQQSYTNHGVGGSGNINADYKGGQGEITGGYNYDDDTQQVNYGLKGVSSRIHMESRFRSRSASRWRS